MENAGENAVADYAEQLHEDRTADNKLLLDGGTGNGRPGRSDKILHIINELIIGGCPFDCNWQDLFGTNSEIKATCTVYGFVDSSFEKYMNKLRKNRGNFWISFWMPLRLNIENWIIMAAVPDIPKHKKQISKLHTVNYSYLIPDSAIPEFAHTGPRISVPRRNSSQQYIMFCTVRLVGYTGFFIYRILNLSPNQAGIRAIDCILYLIGRHCISTKETFLSSTDIATDFLMFLLRYSQVRPAIVAPPKTSSMAVKPFLLHNKLKSTPTDCISMFRKMPPP